MKKMKLAALAVTAVLTVGCMTVPAFAAETDGHVHAAADAQSIYSSKCPKCGGPGEYRFEEPSINGRIHVFRWCSTCKMLYDYYV